MPQKTGIPRALFYYRYYPLWNTFFSELGVEITVSGPTTRNVIVTGVKHCVDEACLPVKVFHGHVKDIKDRVDSLFIPRFISVSKNEFICPKFGGIPDMIRNTFKTLPPLISPEINLLRSKTGAVRAAVETGRHLCKSRRKIMRAYSLAVGDYHKYRQQCINKNISCKKQYRRTVLLVGHPYIVHDSGINMGIVNKLEGYGNRVVTVDMLDPAVIRENAGILNKPLFWNFGTAAAGSVEHVIKTGAVDGIIYLMSFGCGIDSFMNYFTQKRARRVSDIPYMVLNIDEHTGEAGFNTRLEAFNDMLEWRGRNDSDIPASG